MKTFVLTVSKEFPKTHKRAGESTFFVDNIKKLFTNESNKIHTIRGNYNLWAKRAEQINKGEAVLSIRYWSGNPYNSKQVEICILKEIGIENLEFEEKIMTPFEVIRKKDGRIYTPSLSTLAELANNDGLSLDDFKSWFRDYDLNKPMAVIHFTKFRYQTPQQ